MSRPEVGVGMLGYAFMGQVHSFAYRSISSIADRARLTPRLESICGRDPESVERVRAHYGWARGLTDWRQQLEDERLDLFDNGAPNVLHVEPSIAAVRKGKHVLCEKPLAPTADEAYTMWTEAEAAGVVHMCGFNYRFMPAVRLAREMLEAGDLGDVTHFRARFLASSSLRQDQQRTWRFQRAMAGSGALGDLGSHLIDLARYLVGEPIAVSGLAKTFVDDRDCAPVDVDDAFLALVEFENDAIGTLEASRVAGRRSNLCAFEVDGSRGSVAFNLERMNELEVATDRKRTCRIEVTDPSHPFMTSWWPAPGHSIGWGDSFTHEVYHLLAAIAAGESVTPHGADFHDGYRCCEICNAIQRSAETKGRQIVHFRAPRPEDAM